VEFPEEKFLYRERERERERERVSAIQEEATATGHQDVRRDTEG